MALTYGFYNSIEGDRVYDAIQFGRIFDGIIKDGVYATYEKGMMVIASSNPGEVIIQPGRAWFNHTWSYNDANVIFEAPDPEVLLERYDALVLEVNEELSARENSYKWVQGTPSSRPVRPTLTNTATIHQYPLCYVRRYPETTMIYTRDITNMIGTSECPFATGVLEGIDLDAWINQWNDEFHNWENTTKNEFNNWETTTKNEFEAWMLNQEDVYTAWFTALRSQMDSDVQEVEDFVEYLESVLDESTAAHLQQEIDDLKTEITAGSQITVTTLNAELYNRNVTITEPGGTVITEKFNSSGVAEFKSVPYVGDLTIESTYGQQTASKVVNTPYYARYAFEIAFWAATVDIISDAEFAGQSVVVRDSNQAIVGTVVLDNTGAGVYTAIKPDTYKFTLTYGGETMEVTLSVTQETTYTVELYADKFKWEDWVDASKTLHSTDYNSLDEVLADEKAVRELMTVHTCVDYLAGIDEENDDVKTIIENDICAKWINLRDYALDTLAANTVIKGYMDTADKYFYGEWALVGQVPKMTSNTAPYGEAFASSIHSSQYPYYSFDGNDSTYWIPTSNATDNYVGYKFTNPTNVKKLKLKIKFDVVTSAPSRTFALQGSNDGITYTNLGTFDVSYSTSRTVDIEMSVDNDEYYLYYRIFCADVIHIGGQWALEPLTIQFYAWAPKGNVPIMTSETTPYGGVAASGIYSSYSPYKAFNGTCDNNTDCWYVVSGTGWLRRRFVNPICPKKVFVQNRNEAAGGVRAIKDFVIEGSNDGTNWDLLGSYTNTKQGKAEVSWYDITCNDYYLYLQLRFTTSYGNGETAIGRLQFYGRELSDLVPPMTSNTTPRGVASATSTLNSSYAPYKMFDKDATSFWAGATVATAAGTRKKETIGYQFDKPVVAKMFSLRWSDYNNIFYVNNFVVTGSNDGTNFDPIKTITLPNAGIRGGFNIYSLDNDDEYTHYKIEVTAWNETNNSGTAIPRLDEVVFYGLDYSEREFEEGTNKKWLYDHGVEVEPITLTNAGSNSVGQKRASSILIEVTGGTSSSEMDVPNIDFTNYSYMRAKIGHEFTKAGTNVPTFNLSVLSSIPYNWSTGANCIAFASGDASIPNDCCLDVSSINATYYATIFNAANGSYQKKAEIVEWWLE